jgi:hypothetical protein
MSDVKNAKGGKPVETMNDEGMHALNLDRFMWRAKSADCPLDGRIIGRETLQSKEAVSEDNPEGDFEALIIRLLKPASWKDKSGEKITCKAGDDVLVVATAQVKDKLLKHGDNPTHCPRVILSYAGERKLGRGSMNVYSAHFEDEKLWASRSEFAPDTIFVDPFEVKQMGNGIETRQLPAATAS